MATRLPTIVGAALLGLAVCSVAAAEPTRSQRARINHKALMSGRKQPHQLTRRELADVIALEKALHGNSDTRSPTQKCRDDETERVGGAPSELEQQVIDMKCRSLGEPLK